MANTQFYLVQQKENNDLLKDFNLILTQLGTVSGVRFNLQGEHATIRYDQSPLVATLEIAENNIAINNAQYPSPHFILTCDRRDNVSVNLLRNLIKTLNYRIFNPNIGCYLPKDPNLMDVTTLRLRPEIINIFYQQDFIPLFNIRSTYIFYAKSMKDPGIYVINRHLMGHYIDKGEADNKNKDFSYKVADDIGRFIALYDKSLIPTSFYEYIDKPNNIINLSDIDLSNPKKKLMIKPYMYEINDKNNNFVTLGREGRSIAYGTVGDKKRTFDDFLTKILKDMGISENYIAAKVARDVRYEKQKDGTLIPLLLVSIFIENIDKSKSSLGKLRKYGIVVDDQKYSKFN